MATSLLFSNDSLAICFDCLELWHDKHIGTARNIVLDVVNKNSEIGHREFEVVKLTSSEIKINAEFYHYDQTKTFSIKGNFTIPSNDLLKITGKIQSISGVYRKDGDSQGLAIEKLQNLQFENFFSNDWDSSDVWASEINNKGIFKGAKNDNNEIKIADLHWGLDRWLRPKFVGGNLEDLIRGRYYSGQSNLKIAGKGGDDEISGGSQDDTILGGSGEDSISGENGDDFISGGIDDDILNGGYGNDIINGGKGNDTLNGGYGNDIISGGKGNDLITGGGGDDTFTISKGINQVNDFTILSDNIDLGGNGKYRIIDDPGGVMIMVSPNRKLFLNGVNYGDIIAAGEDIFDQPIL